MDSINNCDATSIAKYIKTICYINLKIITIRHFQISLWKVHMLWVTQMSWFLKRDYIDLPTSISSNFIFKHYQLSTSCNNRECSEWSLCLFHFYVPQSPFPQRWSLRKWLLPFEWDTKRYFSQTVFDHFLNFVQQEIGAQPPLGYFDPLGLLKNADEARFNQFRKAELKHGRIAMLAIVGHLVTTEGWRCNGDIAFGVPFSSVKNGLAAFDTIPAGNYINHITVVSNTLFFRNQRD